MSKCIYSGPEVILSEAPSTIMHVQIVSTATYRNPKQALLQSKARGLGMQEVGVSHYYAEQYTHKHSA